MRADLYRGAVLQKSTPDRVHRHRRGGGDRLAFDFLGPRAKGTGSRDATGVLRCGACAAAQENDAIKNTSCSEMGRDDFCFICDIGSNPQPNSRGKNKTLPEYRRRFVPRVLDTTC